MAIGWLIGAPWARAFRRNARFRLRLYGTSVSPRQSVARIICGEAMITKKGVTLCDEQSSVDFNVPVTSQMLDNFRTNDTRTTPSTVRDRNVGVRAEACALIVGSRVVDILLIGSCTLIANCPFVSSQALLSLYHHATKGQRVERMRT